MTDGSMEDAGNQQGQQPPREQGNAAPGAPGTTGSQGNEDNAGSGAPPAVNRALEVSTLGRNVITVTRPERRTVAIIAPYSSRVLERAHP